LELQGPAVLVHDALAVLGDSLGNLHMDPHRELHLGAYLKVEPAVAQPDPQGARPRMDDDVHLRLVGGDHRAAQGGGPDAYLRKLLLELADYFNAPLSTIKTRWQSNTLFSYLPALGLLVGGAVLKGVLGFFSSRDAAARARRNIFDGKVTFEPFFDFLDDGMRAGMGFGMRIRF